jgi:hypothetical protein
LQRRLGFRDSSSKFALVLKTKFTAWIWKCKECTRNNRGHFHHLLRSEWISFMIHAHGLVDCAVCPVTRGRSCREALVSFPLTGRANFVRLTGDLLYILVLFTALLRN